MSVLDLYPTSTPPEPDVETASPQLLQRRALAAIIDIFICYFLIETVLIAAVIGLAPEIVEPRVGHAMALSFVLLVPIYLTYSFAFEWLYTRTPGKVRTELMVVTQDGDNPDLRAAAIRNLVRYLDWLPVGYLCGWLFARRSRQGQRLGDRFAGTIVVIPRAVRERETDWQ